MLNERGKLFKSGEDHDVYIDADDPEKLDRVAKKRGDTSWIKVFKANPTLFPAIFKDIPNGAKVEKLDTVKAQNDYRELAKQLGQDTDFEGILNMTGAGHPPSDLIKSLSENMPPNLASKFIKFVKLVSSVRKAGGLDRVDAHEGNFGYDKQGRLKMIDY